MIVCNLHHSISLIDFKYKQFDLQKKYTKDNIQKGRVYSVFKTFRTIQNSSAVISRTVK